MISEAASKKRPSYGGGEVRAWTTVNKLLKGRQLLAGRRPLGTVRHDAKFGPHVRFVNSSTFIRPVTETSSFAPANFEFRFRFIELMPVQKPHRPFMSQSVCKNVAQDSVLFSRPISINCRCQILLTLHLFGLPQSWPYTILQQYNIRCVLFSGGRTRQRT